MISDNKCIYRKFEVYSMEWHQEIKLENFIAASASYGGPISFRRDEQKFVKVQGTGQPTIHIFSGSGKQISSFKVNVVSEQSNISIFVEIKHKALYFIYFFLSGQEDLLSKWVGQMKKNSYVYRMMV